MERNPENNPAENSETPESFESLLRESETGEVVKREKVIIDPAMKPGAIQEKYNVSRATAFRAIKRGYLIVNYHTRIVDPDPSWNKENAGIIRHSAEKGVMAVLSSRRKLFGMREIAEIVSPYSIEDVNNEAVVRIMEISGFPERDREGWRVKAAKIAAYKFLDKLKRKTRPFYNDEQFAAPENDI
ncbi:MAG: hypothetical protein Q7S16_05635 [bacterium]|nr:hypothetical protein [bacterium]